MGSLLHQPRSELACPHVHQPPELDLIVFSNCFDSYHKSPNSGERQYKSGTCSRRLGPTLRAGVHTPPSNLRLQLTLYHCTHHIIYLSILTGRVCYQFISVKLLPSQRVGLPTRSPALRAGSNPLFLRALI